MKEQSRTVGAVVQIRRSEDSEVEPQPRAPEPVDFTALFHAESSYVWTTLRRLGVRDRDLEDLVHEVFLVVHRHLSDYDSGRPIRPWLFGIAFRVAAGYRRLARTQRELVSDSVEAVDESAAADELVAAKQAQALVLEALDMIDIERKAILVMHEFDGQPVPVIAETLGVPLNTAYSRLRLAREQFTNACRRLQMMRKGRGGRP
jgi:RNA polymerase sigma-70 factor (ECF subfamily)